MTAPGCISGWVSAERGEKGKKHWRLEFEDNRSLLNSSPQFTVWSSHRIYLLWRAPAFFWKACVGPCPTAHSARIWKLTGQCTTGPMQSTGKACYSQAQCLKAYHQAPSLWLQKRGMCLLWNGSVIIRLRPSTFLHYLSSSLKLRKSWEEIDGLIPLYKKQRWWGCTEKKKKEEKEI